MSSRGWASPSRSRRRPPTRARPPPRSSIRRAMTSKLERRRRSPSPARARPGRGWPPACRCCGPAASGGSGSRSSSRARTPLRSRFGHLVEVPGGVESLDGDVVDVVGPLPLRPRPVQDRAAAGVADLLLVLVERLVRRLLPEERQVAGHRDQALADRLAAREVDRAVVAVVARSRRGVARWPNASGSSWSRRGGSAVPKRAWALRVLARWISRKLRCRPASMTNGIDRLDHPGPGGPAAADARRERDDGHLARDVAPPRRARRPRRGRGPRAEDQVVVLDVADVDVDRQAVAGQPDPPALEVLAQAARAGPRRTRSRGGCASAASSRDAVVGSAAACVTGKRWLIIVRKTRSSSPVSPQWVAKWSMSDLRIGSSVAVPAAIIRGTCSV